MRNVPMPACLLALVDRYRRRHHPGPEPLPVADAFVAGLRFHAGLFLRDRLRPGDLVALRRQPDNPHDARAVEVLSGDGRRLGYLPRAVNGQVASLLDTGATLTATVRAVYPKAPPRVGVLLAITQASCRRDT